MWKGILSIKSNKVWENTKKNLKSIRDPFSRNKKKHGTGSSRSNKTNWFFNIRIGCLKNGQNERETTSNVESVDDVNPQNEDTEVIETFNSSADNLSTNIINNYKKNKKDRLYECFEKTAKERQVLVLYESIKTQNKNILKMDDEDDFDLFYKSFALSIKKLPSRGIFEAKLKMLSALAELEKKYSAPARSSINMK